MSETRTAIQNTINRLQEELEEANDVVWGLKQSIAHLQEDLANAPCDHPDLTGEYTCRDCGEYVQDLDTIKFNDDYRVLVEDAFAFALEHPDVAAKLPLRSYYRS